MKVRLVKKFAERVDGIDLRGHRPGETLDLPRSEASLLIAEQWALPDRREQNCPTPERRREADYSPEVSKIP